MNDNAINNNNNSSSAISNFLTPSDDNQTKVEPTSSKRQPLVTDLARSRGGPINIIKKTVERNVLLENELDLIVKKLWKN